MPTDRIVVYVLRSMEKHYRYVGLTRDLSRRLQEHAKRHSKGSQLLGCFELALQENYPFYTEARAREKFLKSGQGRRWLDENLPGYGH